MILFSLCIKTINQGIIIQRHVKGYGSNFAKYWNDYKVGFGSPDGNYYWIGLDRMHELTSSGDYYLEIKLKKGGQTKTVKWTTFSVDSESNKYRLTVGGFDQGTSGLSDWLSYHTGNYFSTPDRDNDPSFVHGSVTNGYSGWWFKGCCRSNLNWGDSLGPYYKLPYGARYDESTMTLKRK